MPVINTWPWRTQRYINDWPFLSHKHWPLQTVNWASTPDTLNVTPGEQFRISRTVFLFRRLTSCRKWFCHWGILDRNHCIRAYIVRCQWVQQTSCQAEPRKARPKRARAASEYGCFLASKDKMTNYLPITTGTCTNLLIMCTKLIFLSSDSQLTAYLRQKHILNNYLT